MTEKVKEEHVLREVILAFRDYQKEYKSSRRLILLIFIPVLGFFTYKQFFLPPLYTAKASFMLNESGGDQSGIASILGQFGIATPGQQVNLQKILEIAKTRTIAENLFFKSEIIDGKSDLLANHTIQNLQENNEWMRVSLFQKKNDYENFRFVRTAKDSFNFQENVALKKLHHEFLKKMTTAYNEKTGIMELAVQTSNQELSLLLCRTLFDELSHFYIDKTIQKQRETYDNLKRKVDSIRAIIHAKDYSLADIKDTYRNVWTSKELVPQTQVDRDIRTLSLIYGEALKNLEIASFTLQNQTPFIQALDLPVKPLEVQKQSFPVNVIKALLYTFLISSIIIILRKIIRDNS